MTVLFDVSTLVADARTDHIAHAGAAAAVTAVIERGEPFLVPDAVVLAVVRITTRTPAFAPPSSTASAFAYLTALLEQPGFVRVAAGDPTFALQERLLAHAGRSTNEVADTYLAALAIEHAARVVSFDRGFARFPGLAWVDPSDPAALAVLKG